MAEDKFYVLLLLETFDGAQVFSFETAEQVEAWLAKHCADAADEDIWVIKGKRFGWHRTEKTVAFQLKWPHPEDE